MTAMRRGLSDAPERSGTPRRCASVPTSDGRTSRPSFPWHACEGLARTPRGGIVSPSAIVPSPMRRMTYHQAYGGGLRQSLAENGWNAGEIGEACNFYEQRNRNQG